MKNNLLTRLSCIGSTGLVGLLALAGFAQASVPFTPGNLVVVRVGDGTAVLTSPSTATFLDEYTTAGVFVQTVAMPVAPIGLNLPLTNSGTSTSEGFLNVSTDGLYFVQMGYGTAPGFVSVAGSSSVTVNRVIGRTSMAAVVDTTTALTDAYSGGNPRSVASDGIGFWTGGTGSVAASAGTRYVTGLGATTSLQLSAAPTNVRVVNIDRGQLYETSSSGTFVGVATVGVGIPTTSGQTTTPLPGFPVAAGPNAYDYFFADPNRVYVADDRSTLLGGIQRWDLIAGVWTLAYTLNPTPSTPIGCHGLTGTVDSLGVATLYATTGGTITVANQIVSVIDTGALSTFTTVTTTATNTAFHGLRFVPAPGSTPFQPYCSGDGTDTACPCANPGLAGRGCNNSAASGGGLLTSTGIAQVSADTLVLHGSFLNPFGPGLYYQGSAPVTLGVAFGHGLRCAGGATPRIEIVVDNGVLPDVAIDGMTDTTVSVSAFGAVNPLGGTYYYQLWYRDTPLFGTCMSGFNFTNAIAVTWAP